MQTAVRLSLTSRGFHAQRGRGSGSGLVNLHPEDQGKVEELERQLVHVELHPVVHAPVVFYENPYEVRKILKGIRSLI